MADTAEVLTTEVLMDVHELWEMRDKGEDWVFWLNLRFDHHNLYLATRGITGGKVETIGNRVVFSFPRLNRPIFSLEVVSKMAAMSLKANLRYDAAWSPPYLFSFDRSKFEQCMAADTQLRFCLHPKED